MKLKYKRLLAIVLTIVLAFSTTACKTSKDNKRSEAEVYNQDIIKESNAFEDYLEELFVDIMSDTDLISVHAYMEHPENYGVTDYKKNLGRIDFENLGSSKEYEEILNKLDSFDYDKLSDSLKVSYDQFKLMMTNEKNNADLYLYNTDIKPTTGVQVQLPLLLAEYSFVEKKDIEEYLLLIADADEYFDDLLKFEKLRVDAGYFLEDSLCDEIIDTCKSFLLTADADDGILISSFNSRIDNFPSLSEEEKSSYKEANLKAVKENVVPAYNNLMSFVETNKGSNKYGASISNYPDGKRYYEYLMTKRLGWSMSMDEFKELGEDYVESLLNDIGLLSYTNREAYNKLQSFSFNMSDPKEILEDLKTKIVEDFPEIKDTDYNIEYVSKALEDYASPAMYFLPQIDNLNINSIYINGASGEEEIYPTLAHEGYPGHLYQTQYFASTNPEWLRYCLAPSGYLEGWASYVEVYSYSFANSYSKEVTKAMGQNYELTLTIYALADLGVNYYGWSEDKLKTFVDDYFNMGDSGIKKMYKALIANPGNYCQYAFGMLGIFELKEKARDELGDSFNIKDFHQYILDDGPRYFDIMFNNIDAWILKEKN